MKQEKENGKAFIKSIDVNGIVIVQFNQEIFVPDDYSEIKDKVITIRITPGRLSDPNTLAI